MALGGLQSDEPPNGQSTKHNLSCAKLYTKLLFKFLTDGAIFFVHTVFHLCEEGPILPKDGCNFDSRLDPQQQPESVREAPIQGSFVPMQLYSRGVEVTSFEESKVFALNSCPISEN